MQKLEISERQGGIKFCCEVDFFFFVKCEREEAIAVAFSLKGRFSRVGSHSITEPNSLLKWMESRANVNPAEGADNTFKDTNISKNVIVSGT